MHDDEMIDQLLRATMSAEVPELSAGFESRLIRRVRPLQLTPIGRAVMTVYVIVAAAAAVWLMQDLPIETIAAACGMSVPVVGGVSRYVRWLA